MPTHRHYDLPPLAQLEAFEASARHLSFTKAADELALTQSAVSRQIAALEEHYALPLFRRLHRALRLTDEGQQLYQAVAEVLGRLHDVGADLTRDRRVKTVIVTTTPGFAGIWLIPRLPSFTALHPDVDVRISAAYDLVNLNRDGVDVAIRYTKVDGGTLPGERLFGEVVFPVCSPKLAREPGRGLRRPEDLRLHTLLHQDSDDHNQLQKWSMWLRAMKLESLKSASSLHFSAYDQLIQAAVNGQGVALGRSPLIDGLLRERKLIAPFEKTLVSARSYYLLQSNAAARKAEVQAFIGWLRGEIEADAGARAVPRDARKPAARKVEVPAGPGRLDRPAAELTARDRDSATRAGRVRT